MVWFCSRLLVLVVVATVPYSLLFWWIIFEIFFGLLLASDHHLFNSIIVYYIYLSQFIICYITQALWMCYVCMWMNLCIVECIYVVHLRFGDDDKIIIRFLIWLLKMRMVHRQFPLDLQHCTLNLQVSVMVLLRSFLFHVHDDDGFDVLHSMPVIVIVCTLEHMIQKWKKTKTSEEKKSGKRYMKMLTLMKYLVEFKWSNWTENKNLEEEYFE